MSKTVKLIHTSDVHGVLESDLGGYLKIASYVKSISNTHILIDTGDFLQGSPETFYLKDHIQNQNNPFATVMNAMGYQYVVPGNHDFNYGLDYLKDFIDHFKGQVLCGNVYKENKPFFNKAYDVRIVEDIKFLLIGLTNHFIPNWEDLNNIKGLTFEHPRVYLEKHLKALKDEIKPDVTVVLYHGGFECDDDFNVLVKDGENAGCEMMMLFPDIDIILSSHEHRLFVKSNQHTFISQPGYQGKQLIEYTIAKHHDKVDIKADIIDMHAMDKDSAIELKIESFRNDAKKYLSQVIGSNHSQSLKVLDMTQDRIRKPMFAQLINAIQLAYTEADISLNAMSNDVIGLEDQITISNIIYSYPYANTLSLCEIDGMTLKEALTENAQFFTIEDGEIAIKKSFLIPKKALYQYDFYDGITYDIIVFKDRPNEVKNILFKHQDIKDLETYRIVLNSYRLLGGGNVTWQKNLKIVKTFPLDVSEIIINTIKQWKVIDLKYEDNIRVMKGE